MRLDYDKKSLTGKYDKRNLTICRCGKHHYPSKKMFIEFLKKFKDVKGCANIESYEDSSIGKVKIIVELTYTINEVKLRASSQD